MIVEQFAQFLKNKKNNENSNSFITLNQWLEFKLTSPCVSNVDKILHREIYLANNNLGCTFFIAKSESGRVLLNALYNFCEYYDNYKNAKQ